MMILGQGALARADGAAILAAVWRIAVTCRLVRDGWNGFNVLHMAAARVGGLDVGFVPGKGGLDVGGMLEGASSGKTEVVYLLGADEIDMRRLGQAFVIYQGHHGDAGANRADVILPGAAYTEKPALYVNTEGRVQQTKRVVFPPGEAREDWAIVRALSEAIGARLPYDNLAELRQRIERAHPHLAERGIAPKARWSSFGHEGRMDQAPFRSPIDDFYMTNAICRASETMAACSALYVGSAAGKTGTHG